jgi:hypothetical protein
MASMVDRDGVALPVDLPNEFPIEEVVAWARGRRHGFRVLWMVQLRERGWSYGKIARVVGLHRSHVCRVVCQARRELAGSLTPEVAS